MWIVIGLGWMEDESQNSLGIAGSAATKEEALVLARSSAQEWIDDTNLICEEAGDAPPVCKIVEEGDEVSVLENGEWRSSYHVRELPAS